MAFAKDILKSFIERIETLESTKKDVGEDIKSVYAEAVGSGFDAKILRVVIRLRKLEPSERQEQDALVEMYLEALGEGNVET